MQEQSLYQEADIIINKWIRDDVDVKRLQTINYLLARQYGDYAEIIGKIKDDSIGYKWDRVEELVEEDPKMSKAMIDSIIEKEIYRQRWGIKLYEYKIEAMKKIMDRIDWCVIAFQSERKNTVTWSHSMDKILSDNYWS